MGKPGGRYLNQVIEMNTISNVSCGKRLHLYARVDCRHRPRARAKHHPPGLVSTISFPFLKKKILFIYF